MFPDYPFLVTMVEKNLKNIISGSATFKLYELTFGGCGVGGIFVGGGNEQIFGWKRGLPIPSCREIIRKLVIGLA